MVNINIESSKTHSHNHDHGHEDNNPHAHITPQERFERLCMFLEAQFGASSLAPIGKPRSTTKLKASNGIKPDPDAVSEDDEEEAELEAAELSSGGDMA